MKKKLGQTRVRQREAAPRLQGWPRAGTFSPNTPRCLQRSFARPGTALCGVGHPGEGFRDGLCQQEGGNQLQQLTPNPRLIVASQCKSSAGGKGQTGKYPALDAGGGSVESIPAFPDAPTEPKTRPQGLGCPGPVQPLGAAPAPKSKPQQLPPSTGASGSCRAQGQIPVPWAAVSRARHTPGSAPCALPTPAQQSPGGEFASGCHQELLCLFFCSVLVAPAIPPSPGWSLSPLITLHPLPASQPTGRKPLHPSIPYYFPPQTHFVFFSRCFPSPLRSS